MAWTKRQFIEAAFEEIGLASYVFDLQPEQMQSALRRLDAMMASWNAQGVRLGYPLSSNPDESVITDSTNVPDRANQAIITNLALKLAPSYGKNVSADTRVTAKESFNTLMAIAAAPLEKKLPGTLPAGAGNKQLSIDRPFILPPADELDVGPDGPFVFN